MAWFYIAHLGDILQLSPGPSNLSVFGQSFPHLERHEAGGRNADRDRHDDVGVGR